MVVLQLNKEQHLVRWKIQEELFLFKKIRLFQLIITQVLVEEQKFGVLVVRFYNLFLLLIREREKMVMVLE